jgi:hypothetical protein
VADIVRVSLCEISMHFYHVAVIVRVFLSDAIPRLFYYLADMVRGFL